MSASGFDMLYEDDAVLAVAKPTGIPTQALPEFDSLESRVRAYLIASGSCEPLYLGIPHRLDRPVSGAMVFAKTRRAARQLARQFERRQVSKIYWAAVEGVIEPAAGSWTDHLRKVYGQPRTQIVEPTHPDGQLAILHYRTLGRHRAGSWLEIQLETGRTHQIRIQTASRGKGIVGDAFYGALTPFGPAIEDERLKPIALHARSLTFFQPDSRVKIVAEAPLPDVWSTLDLTPRE